MNDEKMLSEKAREAIRSGVLPARRPDRTWGGKGIGATCAVCGSPVSPDEVELEIEFRENGRARAPTYHVHVDCFAAWQQELESRDVAAALWRAPADGKIVGGAYGTTQKREPV